MTFPGGSPGGYPGQGPQQPQPGYGYGPPAGPGRGLKLGIPQILHLVVAGLGVLNFFLGFAAVFDADDSNYFDGQSLVPGMLLVGGLYALTAVLPGDKKPGISPAIFSVVGVLTVLFFSFTTSPDLGIGSILLIIFGLLQAVAAVAGYLLEAGLVKLPTPGQNQNQYPHQPGGYGPPSSQFPQPAQQQQPPPQQPGPFAQPGQQTTFQPQQGQFGQPPQHPGTPPGGYPQQS